VNEFSSIKLRGLLFKDRNDIVIMATFQVPMSHVFDEITYSSGMTVGWIGPCVT